MPKLSDLLPEGMTRNYMPKFGDVPDPARAYRKTWRNTAKFAAVETALVGVSLTGVGLGVTIPLNVVGMYYVADIADRFNDAMSQSKNKKTYIDIYGEEKYVIDLEEQRKKNKLLKLAVRDITKSMEGEGLLSARFTLRGQAQRQGLERSVRETIVQEYNDKLAAHDVREQVFVPVSNKMRANIYHNQNLESIASRVKDHIKEQGGLYSGYTMKGIKQRAEIKSLVHDIINEGKFDLVSLQNAGKLDDFITDISNVITQNAVRAKPLVRTQTASSPHSTDAKVLAEQLSAYNNTAERPSIVTPRKSTPPRREPEIHGDTKKQIYGRFTEAVVSTAGHERTVRFGAKG